MAMSHALELYFDPELEFQLLDAWMTMFERQISTKPMDIYSRPHLTLFQSDSVDVGKLANVIRTVDSKQEPLPLSLSSIRGLPSDNNIVFLDVNPSAPLLQFHSQLCDAMKEDGIEIEQKYQPNYWNPRCLMAQEVQGPRIADAFSVLRDLKLPVYGHATEIALVECHPDSVRDLVRFNFGSSSA